MTVRELILNLLEVDDLERTVELEIVAGSRYCEPVVDADPGVVLVRPGDVSL